MLISILVFSHAASPEQSDLSNHYGICRAVCLYVGSLVEIFFTKGIFFTADLAWPKTPPPPAVSRLCHLPVHFDHFLESIDTSSGKMWRPYVHFPGSYGHFKNYF